MLVLRIVFWPFGGFVAAALIIGITLLAALVALYVANIALASKE